MLTRLIRCIAVLAIGVCAGSIALREPPTESPFPGWWTEAPGMTTQGTLVHVQPDGNWRTADNAGAGTWNEERGHITFVAPHGAATYRVDEGVLVLARSTITPLTDSRWVRTRAP